MKKYTITSRSNDTFKIFKDILTSAGIETHGQAFIFGEKAVRETLEVHRDACLGFVSKNGNDEGQRELQKSLQNKAHYMLEPSLFDELDVFGTKKPFLLVKPPQFKSFTQFNDAGRASHDGNGGGPLKVHLVIPFQDPSNVGSLLRSAAAFNAASVILGPGSPHPFHPRSGRAASGTLYKLNYFKLKKWDELFKVIEQKHEEQHFHSFTHASLPIVALDAIGERLDQFQFPKEFFLLPGVEGSGLNSFFAPDGGVAGDGMVCPFYVRVPMEKSVESLNAMVATSVALYEIYKTTK